MAQLPDPRRAHATRTYDHALGGKDNLRADRETMKANRELIPEADARMRAHRRFVERVTDYLVEQAGIRQILDIGCGNPTSLSPNVHEIAQQIAPETRVVYVDSNVIAVRNMDALQADGIQTVAIEGDFLKPEAIVDQASQTLDFDRPVGLLLLGLLHWIPDDADPAGLIAQLCARLAQGSYVAITQMSADLDSRVHQLVDRVFADADTPMVQRPRTAIERLLNGLILIDPGLVPIDQWRPAEAHDVPCAAYGAVARLP